MYLLAPFILQNFNKNSQGQSRVMRMCYFRDQNGPFVMNKISFVQTIIITFIYLLTIFIVQNLKKFLQRIQSYEDAPFWGPKWSICPKQIFFGKIINIILTYLLALSLCKILKNFFQRIQSYENVQLLGQNEPFPRIRIFFRKPVNEPCSFIHACLHAKNQSQILICQ